MRLKTFLAVAVCVGVIVVALRIRTANDPDAIQWRQIDAFYAQVKSNPSDFPPEVRTVVDVVEKCRKATIIPSRRTPSHENPDDPPVLAMLQRQATPEQIAGWQIWKKATIEAASALRYGRDRLRMGDTQAVQQCYNDFVRTRFGAPRIGMIHPQPGIDEFYIIRDEPAAVVSPTKADDRNTTITGAEGS